MRCFVGLLVFCAALPLTAQTMQHMPAMPGGAGSDSRSQSHSEERLGTVSFPVSCAGSQAGFNRGVALLHDFWYEEAHNQFERIAKADPKCAMAHWGVAMSGFHQIWERPGAATVAAGWAEMQKAQALSVGTERERAYIAALSDFYRPGKEEYPARISGYSKAMGSLYARYPDDVNAGAFYALSLLAAESPDDTSLAQQHKAMAVLTPLWAKYPDNPGVVHYIIHSCDNPSLAAQGRAAADHYGEIAPSGAHAFHMPGHIYARLGLWPQDIAAQLGSIKAAQEAEARGESGIMDEPHSYDFLQYAYLQSGQDARAKAAMEANAAVLKRMAAMPAESLGRMGARMAYFGVKLPIFNALEMRDWRSAAALEPPAGSPPEVVMQVDWARAIAHGRLRQAKEAKADLDRYDELTAEVMKGNSAYLVEGTGVKIERGEMLAWSEFAAGRGAEALEHLRTVADLQDKVGQAEVDIPAREMLADMLLELGHAKRALAEYEVALKLSPNRLNGLYGAGRASEAAGNSEKARFYYAALLSSTNNGRDSSRPEFAHAKGFVSSAVARR